MILPTLALAVALSMAPKLPPLQSADTIQITNQVKRKLGLYYYTPRDSYLEDPKGECSKDLGHECFGADPDRFPCPIDTQCHPIHWLEDLTD